MQAITWSGSAFDYFVTSVLRQISSEEHKEVFFEASLPLGSSEKKTGLPIIFDAIALNGLRNIAGPVVFEYKYTIKDKKLGAIINNLSKRLAQLSIDVDITLVLITNSSIGENINLYNKSSLNQKNIKLIIWDHTEVQKWVKKYPIDVSNALNMINPAKAKEVVKDITNKNFAEKSQNNLSAVKRSIENEDNFAFVLGAGISVDPGAKSWDSLLKYFTTELVKSGVINDSNKLSEKIGGSSIITAQLCKELYPNENDYFWAIHNGLYDSKTSINTDFSLYHIAKIASLCINISHFRVLTYNYDEYLEVYLDHLGIGYSTLFDSKCDVNENLSIYHVHGFLPQVSYKSHIQPRHQRSIYLTEENYNELYNDPYSWQISSQMSFFRENTCLFVGCSLADPNIRRLLEITKKENRTHYAILTEDKMTTNDLVKASNHFARLGIEVIWAKDYTEVSHQLRILY